MAFILQFEGRIGVCQSALIGVMVGAFRAITVGSHHSVPQNLHVFARCRHRIKRHQPIIPAVNIFAIVQHHGVIGKRLAHASHRVIARKHFAPPAVHVHDVGRFHQLFACIVASRNEIAHHSLTQQHGRTLRHGLVQQSALRFGLSFNPSAHAFVHRKVNHRLVTTLETREHVVLRIVVDNLKVIHARRGKVLHRRRNVTLIEVFALHQHLAHALAVHG